MRPGKRLSGPELALIASMQDVQEKAAKFGDFSSLHEMKNNIVALGEALSNLEHKLDVAIALQE